MTSLRFNLPRPHYITVNAMRLMISLWTESVGLLLLILLACLRVSSAQKQQTFQPHNYRPTLSFRHIYHHSSSTGKYPGMFRRMDFTSSQATAKSNLLGTPSLYGVKHTVGKRYRAAAPLPNLMRAARTPRQLHYAMGIHNMEIDYGLLPDVKDRETVLSLAEMTNNAYSDPDTREDWYDLGTKWNVVG